MTTNGSSTKKYTITEVAKISGLPESTLRYYETIGLIEPVERNVSTKRRVYSESDMNGIIAVACLNAIGFSIEDMRKYLENRTKGSKGATQQIELLESQEKHMEDEIHLMQMRLRYISSKVDYWKAVKVNDVEQVKRAGEVAYSIAEEMKLPSYRPK